MEPLGMLAGALLTRAPAEAEAADAFRAKVREAILDGTLVADHGPAHWKAVEIYGARMVPEKVLASVAPTEIRLLLDACAAQDVRPPGTTNAGWLLRMAERFGLDQSYAAALRRAVDVASDITRLVRMNRWVYLGGSAVDLHRVVAVLHVADRLDPEHTDCPPPPAATDPDPARWPNEHGVSVGLIDPREGVMRLDLTSPEKILRRQAEETFLPWCDEALKAVRNVLLACGMPFREVEVHDLHARPSADALAAQELMRTRAGARRRPPRPFKFLDPFGEDEYHLLAARDEETVRLTGRALTAPITVLTGESGSGKTSLVAAGVIPWLRMHSYEGIYARCLNDPAAALLAAAQARLPEGKTATTLTEAVRILAERNEHPVVLVLDQAQELFTRLGSQTRLDFAEQVARLLSIPGDQIHFLLVIQREFFHSLIELQPVLPTILGEVVELHRLNREQSELVIQRSLGRFRLRFDELVTSHLIDDLMTVDGLLPAELQVVCDALHAAVEEDETRIGYEVYRRIGPARRVLEGVVESRIRAIGWYRKQSLARSILVNCVTAQRTKALVTAEECAVDSGSDLETTIEVLEALEGQRLLHRLDLGGHDGWELRHEYLAQWLEPYLKDVEREAKDVDDLLHRELNNFERFGLLLDKEKLKLIHRYRRRLSLTPTELELAIRSSAQEQFEADYWFGRVSELALSQQMVLCVDLLYSPEAGLREALRAMVSRLDRQAVLPTLLASLQEAEPTVRETALALLEGSDQQLVATLSSGDTAQQSQAAYALGQLGSRQAVVPLVESVQSAPNEEVRERAAEALAEIDRSRSAELLIRSLRSGGENSRWNAAMALGRLGRDAGVRERLRREAERREATEVVLFAYARACVEGQQFADADRLLKDLERRAVPAKQRARLEQAISDLAALRVQEQKGALSWPMYRCGPTGVAFTPMSLNLPLDLKWEFATSDCIYSSPAVAGGKVYIGSDDHQLYALDADSGEQRWICPTAAPLRSSPCVLDSAVFVGDSAGTLHAVDTETGRELWSRQLGSAIESSPRGDSEQLLVGTADGCVVALSPADGTERWRRQLQGGRIEASPAAVGDCVAVGCVDEGVAMLSASDGEVRWRWRTEGGLKGSPVFADGRLVIGSASGRLDALGLDGELQWSAFLAGPVGSSPAVAHRRVYVGASDGEIAAFELATGRRSWTFETEGDVTASPAVAAGTVFVGTLAGNLFGLDARTGEPLWRYRTGYSIHSSPAVADKRLFVAMRYYNMCAFAEAVDPEPS